VRPLPSISCRAIERHSGCGPVGDIGVLGSDDAGLLTAGSDQVETPRDAESPSALAMSRFRASACAVHQS
jgi:hypothetical protein